MKELYLDASRKWWFIIIIIILLSRWT